MEPTQTNDRQGHRVRDEVGRCVVALVAVLVGYVALTLAYLVSIPPWEAPDEPAHFLRIRNLACGLDLGQAKGWTCADPRPEEDLGTWYVQPVDSADPSTAICRNVLPPMRKPWDRRHLFSSYMSGRPPLGHLTFVPWFVSREAIYPPALLNPDYPRVRSPVFLHGLDRDPSLSASVTNLRLLRIPGVLWGLITVCSTWVCGRLLVPEKPGVALTAAALVAFLPQFTFLSAYLSSDGFAVAASALLTTWVLYGLLRRGVPFWVWLAGAIMLLALAVGARLNAAGLAAMVGVGAVLAPRRRHLGAAAGLLAAIMGAGFIALPAVWEIYFDQADASLGWGGAMALMTALDLLGRSFVGVFGWMRIELPAVFYWTAAGSTVLFAGLAMAWIRRPGVETEKRREAAATLSAGIALVAGSALLHALSIGQAQGRYLFPALPALASLAGAGLCGRQSARRGLFLASALALVLAGANVGALLGVVRPAYGAAEGDRLSRIDADSGPLILQHGLRRPSPSPSGAYPFDSKGQILLVAPPGPPRTLRLRAALFDVRRIDLLRRAVTSEPLPDPADLPGIEAVETEGFESAEAVRPVWITHGENPRRGLFAHPTTRITLTPFTVPAGALLRVTFGYLQRPRDDFGDGVEFRVLVRSSGYPDEVLVERYLDPGNEAGHRRLVTEAIDLKRLADQRVRLVLETLPGAEGNHDRDWVAWVSAIVTTPHHRVPVVLCTDRGTRIPDPRAFEVEMRGSGILTFQLPPTLVERYESYRLVLE